MRALQRLELPADTEAWLEERQQEVDGHASPDTTAIWKTHREALNTNGVRAVLVEMVGRRQRCMYCGDSLTTDIEHHRPKRRFPGSMFVWHNLLWACRACNGRKGQTFPVTGAGEPLLIDPTACDPWEHLYFVHETGQLTPRVDVSGVEDPRGAATTDPRVLPLNIEPITEARQRAWRALRRAVTRFLADEEEDLLVEEVTDSERPEIVVWALSREGSEVSPFNRLRREHPALTLRLVALVR